MNSGVYIERHIKRDWNEWIYLSFINQDWVRTNCEKDKDNRSQWEQLFYLHKMYNESNIFLKFKNTRFYSNKKTSTAHLTLYLLFFFLRRSFSSPHFPPSLLFPLMFTICCFIYYRSKEPNTSYTLHRPSIHSLFDSLQHWMWSVIFDRKLYRRNHWQMKSRTKFTSGTFFFLHYFGLFSCK